MIKSLRACIYTRMRMPLTDIEALYGSGIYEVDYIALHINKYIYQCKYLEKQPHSEEFFHMMCSEMYIEGLIAEKRDKLGQHKTKWNKINVFNITNIT